MLRRLAEEGDIIAVKLALDAGVVADAPDDAGVTALQVACQHGLADVAAVLVGIVPDMCFC
jgi:ankyrin repeat protein